MGHLINDELNASRYHQVEDFRFTGIRSMVLENHSTNFSIACNLYLTFCFKFELKVIYFEMHFSGFHLFLHSAAIEPSIYIRKIKSINKKVTSIISLGDVK